MKSQLKNSILTVLALGLGTVAGYAQLANPSFELATGADADSWIQFGNFGVQQEQARTGTNSYKLFGNFTGGENVSGAFQEFTAVEGELWTLDGFGLNVTGDEMQGENFSLLKLAYKDAGDGELAGFESAFLTAATPKDSWDAYQASGYAPAGTVQVEVFMLFIQPGDQENPYAGGAAFWDDLSVTTIVPEPTTFALAGIGAAALLIFRRRR